MSRKVVYVSGTRADFGLLADTLELASSRLDVSVCVTGMHLDERYGHTVTEIEQSALRICGRVRVPLDDADGVAMGKAIAAELSGMLDVFASEQPDIVMLLGDRGEMLAGAVAALHLNIPIVHLHGGELSGTVDEPVRHAISKLSHYHFTATEQSRERLIRMGERPDRIFVTGAPGLDSIARMATIGRDELCVGVGLSSQAPIALVIFHPVVQQIERMSDQTLELMCAVLEDPSLQAVVLLPNADAGSNAIRNALRPFVSARCRAFVHLSREQFVSWMAAADVMVGNSSSGIIEAASLGLPVVNVGERQSGRERNSNVIDVPVERRAIAAAIAKGRAWGRRTYTNVYGDGRTGPRIVKLLETLSIDDELLLKINAY